jgi:transposase-like protein
MKTVQALMMEIEEEFSIEMLNEDACRDWFLRKIHSDGIFCPYCHEAIASERLLKTFWSMKRIHCPGCGRTFSAVTGTVLNGIGIEFRALYLLLFMIGCGVSVNKVKRQIGISTGAAYIWANKAKSAASLPEEP